MAIVVVGATVVEVVVVVDVVVVVVSATVVVVSATVVVASTVVDVSADRPRILREGAIPRSRLEAILAAAGIELDESGPPSP